MLDKEYDLNFNFQNYGYIETNNTTGYYSTELK